MTSVAVEADQTNRSQITMYQTTCVEVIQSAGRIFELVGQPGVNGKGVRGFNKNHAYQF